jgi:hypothetical protein
LVGPSYSLTDDRWYLRPCFLTLVVCCPLENLVFRWEETPDASTRRELSERGFGISTFSEPHAEEVFDLDGYAEMFAEWGWTGNAAAKPTWMDDPRSRKSDVDPN